MKKIALLLISVLCISVFSSCQSQEERTISKLEKIAARLEASDDMEEDEWEKLQSDYEAAVEQAKNCEFTKEQREQISKLEGKITRLMIKKVGNDMGKGFKDLINGAKDAAEETKGFFEGLTGSDKD